MDTSKHDNFIAFLFSTLRGLGMEDLEVSAALNSVSRDETTLFYREAATGT